MLGLLLIYFIGKAFYDLAGQYKKSMWGYAILGIVTYYFGTFLFGIGAAILGEMDIVPPIEEINEYLLGFMAMPLGILTCWLSYRTLAAQWSRKSTPEMSSDLLDSELINQNREL